jgi:chaperonin GroES
MIRKSERRKVKQEEETQMKLVPLGDKVILRQLIAEETTASGILIPGQSKEMPQQAEVLAVGPGGMIEGKEIVMQVKVADKVIYSKYAGTEVELEKETFIVVKQSDILAIIES